MGACDSIVTVGMRGDSDKAMSEETAVELLQQIIADQLEIIADVIPASRLKKRLRYGPFTRRYRTITIRECV